MVWFSDWVVCGFGFGGGYVVLFGVVMVVCWSLIACCLCWGLVMLFCWVCLFVCACV